MEYLYEKTQHTKTGQDLWVVKLNKTLSTEDFSDFKQKMRSIGNGGKWSPFVKGFIFYADVEEQLNDMLGEPFETNIDNTDNNGIRLKRGEKLNKNSKYIKYISDADKIKNATYYHLGYDEPFPDSNHDPISADSVIKELKEKDYDALIYEGDGHFHIRVNSNCSYNFDVEGVSDLVEKIDTTLRAYNFFIPIEKKAKNGESKLDKKEVINDYKLQAEVHFLKFGFEDKGVIEKDARSNYSITSHSYGDEANAKTEISTIYNYDIKRDDGVIIKRVDPKQIKEDSSPLIFPFDYVTTKIKVYLGNNSRSEQHPYTVWDYLIRLVNSYKHYAEKERRAKKQSNIDSWKRRKEETENSLKTLKKDWYDWEISNFNNFVFSRMVTGETEAEQKERLEVWSKNNSWELNIPKEIKTIDDVFEDDTQGLLDINAIKEEMEIANAFAKPISDAVEKAEELMDNIENKANIEETPISNNSLFYKEYTEWNNPIKDKIYISLPSDLTDNNRVNLKLKTSEKIDFKQLLDISDKHNIDIYLETPNLNLANYYNQFGFKLLDDGTMLRKANTPYNKDMDLVNESFDKANEQISKEKEFKEWAKTINVGDIFSTASGLGGSFTYKINKINLSDGFVNCDLYTNKDFRKKGALKLTLLDFKLGLGEGKYYNYLSESDIGKNARERFNVGDTFKYDSDANGTLTLTITDIDKTDTVMLDVSPQVIVAGAIDLIDLKIAIENGRYYDYKKANIIDGIDAIKLEIGDIFNYGTTAGNGEKSEVLSINENEADSNDSNYTIKRISDGYVHNLYFHSILWVELQNESKRQTNDYYIAKDMLINYILYDAKLEPSEDFISKLTLDFLTSVKDYVLENDKHKDEHKDKYDLLFGLLKGANNRENYQISLLDLYYIFDNKFNIDGNSRTYGYLVANVYKSNKQAQLYRNIIYRKLFDRITGNYYNVNERLILIKNPFTTEDKIKLKYYSKQLGIEFNLSDYKTFLPIESYYEDFNNIERISDRDRIKLLDNFVLEGEPIRLSDFSPKDFRSILSINHYYSNFTDEQIDRFRLVDDFFETYADDWDVKGKNNYKSYPSIISEWNGKKEVIELDEDTSDLIRNFTLKIWNEKLRHRLIPKIGKTFWKFVLDKHLDNVRAGSFEKTAFSKQDLINALKNYSYKYSFVLPKSKLNQETFDLTDLTVSEAYNIILSLDVDRKLLDESKDKELTEATLNDWGYIDKLKDSVNKSKAKVYFEQKEGKTIPPFKVNIKITQLLKHYLLNKEKLVEPTQIDIEKKDENEIKAVINSLELTMDMFDEIEQKEIKSVINALNLII